MTLPTAADVERARARLAGIARVTPVVRSETFSRLAGRDVWLKAENLQRTGSFKVRGAVNRVAALDEDERARGVVAASAGNHGQAVAWAAREAGVPATIFVPQDAPMAKVEATRNYGADVELVGESFERGRAGRPRARRVGGRDVHPRVRGPGRRRRPGNGRARARRAARRRRDGGRPGRRWRARRRNRAAQCPARLASWACGRVTKASRSPTASR